MKIKNSKNNQKHLKFPAVYNIVGELKYRALYLVLLVICLLGLIYLNYGLIIEFQGSYYLNYYQFIDFSWCEGVKELKIGLLSKPVTSDNFENSNCVSLNFLKLQKSLECFRLFLVFLETKFKNGYFWFFDPESLAQVEKLQEWPNQKNTLIHCFDNRLSLTAWQSKATNPAVEKNENFSYIEIDEYKPFFISTLSYFSGQSNFFYSAAINPETYFFEKPRNLLIYLMFLFYQLTGILAYQTFCLVSPAITRRFQLRLLKNFFVFYLLLCLHFLLNPMVMAINYELQIESLDSELFYGNSFDFLKLWLKSFYWLLTFLTLVSLFYYFASVIFF